jgi:hypothetical protein
MAAPSIDVDQVVREVLAALGLAPGGTGGLSESGHGDSGNEALADKPPVAPGRELVLNCRVITLSEVDGRLEAVRRLVVPPGAVITPAVRDELSRRNVTLTHSSPPAAPVAAPLRLVLVMVGKPPDPAPLLGPLANEGIEIAQHSLDCLMAATDLLAGEIAKPHTLGLLLTRHTAAGLCLANRLPGVRAVSGTDAGTVAAAAAAVGANLLVLDPAAVRPFPLKQIALEFCRGGTRPCPEVFEERLA